MPHLESAEPGIRVTWKPMIYTASIACSLLASFGLDRPASAAPAATAAYQADLLPMPVDDETKAFIAGRGAAKGSYDGRSLTVTGKFTGLASKATEAFLLQSPYIAVPGKKIFNLTVTKATDGDVSGTLKLTRAQAAALRTGNLYIQINAEGAPPGYAWGPKGSVWGWLLPQHETVAAGVPQQGHWFLPQLDTPQAATPKLRNTKR